MEKSNLDKVFINRNFFLFWLGQAVSIFGNLLLSLALPIMTYNITGRRTTLGLTIMLQAIPVVLAGPFSGALIDRWNKKKTIVIADILRALLLIPLIIVKGRSLLYVIYAVSFSSSLVGIFFEPAFAAAMPKIAGRENVLKANSLIQTIVSIVKLIAPLLGTALYTLLGTGILIGIDILTFIVSIVTMLLINTDLSTMGSENISFKAIKEDIASGIRYISARRKIAIILTASLFLAFFNGIMNVQLLPYVKDVLNAGNQGYGIVVAIQGGGQIIGSIIIGLFGKKMDRGKLCALCFWGIAFVTIPYTNVKTFAMLLPFACLMGFFMTGMFIGINTLIQTTVDESFMGRVDNSFSILLQAGMLVTTLASGILSDRYGVRPVLESAIGIMIIGALMVIPLFKMKNEWPDIAEDVNN